MSAESNNEMLNKLDTEIEELEKEMYGEPEKDETGKEEVDKDEIIDDIEVTDEVERVDETGVIDDLPAENKGEAEVSTETETETAGHHKWNSQLLFMCIKAGRDERPELPEDNRQRQ